MWWLPLATMGLNYLSNNQQQPIATGRARVMNQQNPYGSLSKLLGLYSMGSDLLGGSVGESISGSMGQAGNALRDALGTGGSMGQAGDWLKRINPYLGQ